MRGLVTILILLELARSARAEPGAVIVHGAAKPRLRHVVEAAVTDRLREATWSVSPMALGEADKVTVIACLALDRPWPCVAPTADASGVQRIAIVEVDTDPATKAVVVTAQILVRGDAVPSIERRFCEACTETTLTQTATEAVAAVLERTSARHGATLIAIRTVPPGATVSIDGTMVGSSDATVPVAAGRHEVQVQRSGFRPETRTVTVVEGQTSTIELTLVAASGSSAGRPPPRRSRLLPALVIGAGAVALVGGTAYSLSVDPPTTFEQPRRLYSGAGIATASVGALAIGAGVYLWLRAGRATSLPTATVTSGGGVIGWAGSF